MKVYFKKDKGVTIIALIITIIVMLILAGVGISAITPGGIIDKVENTKHEILVKERMKELYSELGYNYYKTFNEELGGSEDTQKIVRQLAEADLDLNLPMNVFVINYSIDFDNWEVDKNVKKLYYRYDKIVSRKENDSIYYELKPGEKYEAFIDSIDPNDEEEAIINKLEGLGIKRLKGDINFDGVLDFADVTRMEEIGYWENCDGFFGATHVEISVGDITGDEYVDISDSGMLSYILELLK